MNFLIKNDLSLGAIDVGLAMDIGKKLTLLPQLPTQQKLIVYLKKIL